MVADDYRVIMVSRGRTSTRISKLLNAYNMLYHTVQPDARVKGLASDWRVAKLVLDLRCDAFYKWRQSDIARLAEESRPRS